MARYKLDLVGVKEVTWDKGGTVKVEDYNYFYGKGNENHQLGTGFLVHHRILGDTQGQAQELISGPCLGAKTKFLSFNRTQSRAVTGLLIGHNTFRDIFTY